MGKGDKKTKRGKISRGTFGARRLRKKTKPIVAAKKKTTKAKTEANPKVTTKPKMAAKPKVVTKPKATAKAKPKAAAKK
jgi:30S ribosomal protein S31